MDCRLRPDIAPGSALLHPLWLASLCVLALNDHVLKGSALVPAAITGKLSDVAGLVVAPVLLAAILRVRSRCAWSAVHVAVGVVFAGIQLLAPVAAAWAAIMDSLGFAWHITMDPGDLLALPALAISWSRLRGTSRGDGAAVLRLGTGTVGLVCCAATSPPPGEPFRPSIFTDVYVHNGGDADLVIRIRYLAPSVDVDCARIAEDPGRLLAEPLFGPASSWTLPPGVNHGLYGSGELDAVADDRECRVVLFDADNVPPAIVFWQVGDPPMHTVDGEAFDPEDRGAIELRFDDAGHGEYGSGEELVFLPVTDAPAAGTCAPQPDQTRLDFSMPLPVGEWTLAAIDRGFDGCFAIDLVSAGLVGRRWYVCAPLPELPFTVGDLVRIDPRWDAGAAADEDSMGIIVTRIGSDAPAVELHLTRGAMLPAIADIQFAEVPDFACGYASEPACGTVARAASLTVGGGGYGSTTLRPGDPPAELPGADGSAVTVWLAHAQDRIALDPQCALGPDTLGIDLEIAAVFTPAAQ